jgi:hypothetical protein
MATEKLVATLEEQRAMLLQYLRSKLDAGDLHAVQDAASDMREIDAKLEILRSMGKS